MFSDCSNVWPHKIFFFRSCGDDHLLLFYSIRLFYFFFISSLWLFQSILFVCLFFFFCSSPHLIDGSSFLSNFDFPLNGSKWLGKKWKFDQSEAVCNRFDCTTKKTTNFHIKTWTKNVLKNSRIRRLSAYICTSWMLHDIDMYRYAFSFLLFPVHFKKLWFILRHILCDYILLTNETQMCRQNRKILNELWLISLEHFVRNRCMIEKERRHKKKEGKMNLRRRAQLNIAWFHRMTAKK